MNEKQLKQLIKKFAGDRTKLIDALLADLEKSVTAAQKQLLQRFVADWVESLDVDDATGQIKNTLRNKRLLNNIDNIFSQYVKTEGVAIAKTMMDGIKQVLDFNGEYYKGFNKKVDVIPIQAQAVEVIKSWLGIKGNGWLQGNGYLSKTINDPKTLSDLKDLGLRAVIGQQGYEATKSAVKLFIDGNPQTAGALQKYYRNFVYDIYSQVDRTTAMIYADKLKLDYAIYEGGLIKTSRKFCRERNGKVFTRDEISVMDPKVGIPDNYNPFTDMGGYGCRHHWNWIPYSLAIVFRPDLAMAA